MFVHLLVCAQILFDCTSDESSSFTEKDTFFISVLTLFLSLFHFYCSHVASQAMQCHPPMKSFGGEEEQPL